MSSRVFENLFPEFLPRHTRQKVIGHGDRSSLSNPIKLRNRLTLHGSRGGEIYTTVVTLETVAVKLCAIVLKEYLIRTSTITGAVYLNPSIEGLGTN